MDWLIEDGDEIALDCSKTVEGRWVRPEEQGFYVHDGRRLVRKSDGYVFPVEIIADPDGEC